MAYFFHSPFVDLEHPADVVPNQSRYLFPRIPSDVPICQDIFCFGILYRLDSFPDFFQPFDLAHTFLVYLLFYSFDRFDSRYEESHTITATVLLSFFLPTTTLRFHQYTISVDESYQRPSPIFLKLLTPNV